MICSTTLAVPDPRWSSLSPTETRHPTMLLSSIWVVPQRRQPQWLRVQDSRRCYLRVWAATTWRKSSYKIIHSWNRWLQKNTKRTWWSQWASSANRRGSRKSSHGSYAKKRSNRWERISSTSRTCQGGWSLARRTGGQSHSYSKSLRLWSLQGTLDSQIARSRWILSPKKRPMTSSRIFKKLRRRCS